MRTIVAIGGTGVGKSTTMNSVAGRKVFAEGCGLASVTQATQRHDDAARGLALLDVPGLDDPAGPAADAAHTADMVERLVGHGRVHLFAVCFNGASPRLTSSLQQQLQLFGAVFGAGFLANVVLVEDRAEGEAAVVAKVAGSAPHASGRAHDLAREHGAGLWPVGGRGTWGSRIRSEIARGPCMQGRHAN